MDAFDLLGPLSREVLAETPIDIDLARLQATFRQRQANERMARAMSTCTDQPAPTPGQTDAAFAAFIEAAIRQKVPGYKPIKRVLRKLAR